MGKSPNVTVTFQDYKTLEHDTFLNDIIIDFYLTYLHTNNLNKEDAPNVYIFSTMFYKRMLTQPSRNAVVHSLAVALTMGTAWTNLLVLSTIVSKYL